MKILPYKLISDYASKSEKARLRDILIKLTKALNLSQAGGVAWMLWLTTTAADLSAARLNLAVNRGRNEFAEFIKVFTRAIELGGGFKYFLIGQNGTTAIVVLANDEYSQWQLTEASPEQNFYRFSREDIRGFSELMSKQVHSTRMN